MTNETKWAVGETYKDSNNPTGVTEITDGSGYVVALVPRHMGSSRSTSRNFMPPMIAAAPEMYEGLEEIAQYMRDIVETRKNGDLNNWNGYYVPLFEKLADKYAVILAKAGRA